MMNLISVDTNYCKCYNIIVSAELEQHRDSELSLEGLVDMVQAYLEQSANVPADARVAEVPDARTLRYYQTLKIIDKPLRYEGRKAVYGYRHFLQALGIKLLQGQGYSLAQVQQTLSGIGRVELERVVVDALGDFQSVPGAPPPILSRFKLREEPGGKTLIAVEVGQGVSVILDPVQVDDPEVVLVAMRELLSAIRDEG